MVRQTSLTSRPLSRRVCSDFKYLIVAKSTSCVSFVQSVGYGETSQCALRRERYSRLTVEIKLRQIGALLDSVNRGKLCAGCKSKVPYTL